jgi:hypothetical protein
MIRVPEKYLKDSQPHLSLDAGNLPVPTEQISETININLLLAADKISTRDRARILNKDSRLSKKTTRILNEIKCSNYAL